MGQKWTGLDNLKTGPKDGYLARVPGTGQV